MEYIFYLVVIVILTLTLPFASKNVVYGAKGIRPYTPLGGLSNNQKRAAQMLLGIITLILIAVCVWRSEDMCDYAMYLRMYSMGGGENMNRELEPTFKLIVSVSPVFLIFLAIYAILSVSSHVYSIMRNSPNIWLTFLLYLTMYFVLHDMVQIRAAVAIGLLLIAVRYIVERKWITYYILVIIASFFHYSAAVFLFLYFIPHKHLNKWVWSGMLILFLAFGLLNMQFAYFARLIPLQFVQNYLEAYLGNRDYTASAIGPVRVIKVICAIIMVFGLPRIKRIYPFAVPVLCFYIISQMCYLLFGDIPVLQGRMGELFGSFEIFALAMFPLLSKKHYYLLCIVPVALALYNFQTGIFLLREIAR